MNKQIRLSRFSLVAKRAGSGLLLLSEAFPDILACFLPFSNTSWLFPQVKKHFMVELLMTT